MITSDEYIAHSVSRYLRAFAKVLEHELQMNRKKESKQKSFFLNFMEGVRKFTGKARKFHPGPNPTIIKFQKILFLTEVS